MLSVVGLRAQAVLQSKPVSRSRRVIEGLSWGYVALAANTLISLVITPYYLARLGAELLGFSFFISETINYLQIAELGIPTALAAIIAKDLQPDVSNAEREAVIKKLRAGGQIQLLLSFVGLLATLVLALALQWFAKGLPAEHLFMARVFTVLIGIDFSMRLCAGVFSSVLVGKQLMGQNALYKTVVSIGAAGIGVALVSAGWSLYGLGVASVVSGAAFLFQVRWRALRTGLQLNLLRRPIELEAMRKVIEISGWVLLASAGALLSFHSSRVILGITPEQGMTAVNKYSLLMAVPLVMRFQANRISVMVRPGLTQLTFGKNGDDRSREVGFLLLRVVGLLAAGSFLVIWAVNGCFVIQWVGREHYAGDTANFLVASMTGILIWIFGFKVMLEVRFMFRRRGLAFAASGVLCIALALILVRLIGLPGVILAVIIGEGLVAVTAIVPTGLRWLSGSRSPLSVLWRGLSVPALLLGLWVAVLSSLGWRPSSWFGILSAALLIGGSCGGIGLLWLWEDLRPFLPFTAGTSVDGAPEGR